MNEPRELSPEKCRELLAAGVVGRVAVCAPDGPHIVPVNYVLIDDSIIFRTEPYTLLGRLADDARLGFEVDNLDHERHRGWSVLAIGPAESVVDPDEIASMTAIRDPRPWAAGDRRLHIRLTWTSLTGRRLGHWSPDDETPVRRAL
ncbi:pyridoxamine 5'-phosphate oxidase family protein [Nocardioides sp. JQ2195]|uniref:pyridoxamine 5'-phosphate oxidase family protein n=1 Tax=Nocardioides sp. JQ2195 TaxID=2592334 RepID=UPI00143EE8F6|nr:pyridoxamine 5'-phosphate oxidase family protein [Nocardioides sp. JQ2195]QIX26725.1 pyridoxamine 5'-phosphate oxidase family protein [Nocardioides sp. JQ2195]